MQQALERAAAHSPALLRGMESVNKAKAGVLGATNAFLPQVDLSAQLARYGNKGRQATLIGSSVVQSEAAFYGSYAALSASLNLYSGGRSRAGYLAANSELDAAREDYGDLQVRQFAQLLEGYAALIKAQEEYRSLHAQERLYVAQEKIANSAYRQGRASRLEVSNARLLSGKWRLQVLQQLTSLEGRAGQLAVSLGMELPAGERLMASDILPEAPELPEDMTMEQVALDHPALRAAELRLEAARNKVHAARGMFLPKVDLVGSYNWVGQDDSSASDAIGATRANSYSVGLTLQQHLAPFAGENAALQTAQAELREAEAQSQEVRLGLGNAKRQALAELAQARAALALASQAEEDANEVVFLQQARLRHGRGDERALIEAQANLSQRQLERFFQDTNLRLLGWAAYAILDPRRYAGTLLDRVR
ncbi:MAG: TolC family protein [Gallionellaceae bacterium]|nr:TolC family protein [Gallionellaceae bacterium]